MQIMVPFEVTDRQALDIISTALEGGIGYWSQADVIVRGSDTETFPMMVCDELDYVQTDLYDAEDVDVKFGTLTVETIYQGIIAATSAGAAGALAIEQLLRDDIDADGADTFVQLGLLGEVVYG